MGGRRRDVGNGRQEMREGKWKTGDGRHEMRDKIQETSDKR